MHPFIIAVLVLLSLAPSIRVSAEEAKHHPGLKGWDHLLTAMIGAGMSEEAALKLVGDERFPEFDFITFKIRPKESPAPYAKLNTAERRKNALEFYNQHRSSFERAESEFGVPRSIILAIIQVETGCGKNFGKHPVFIRLARFVGLGDPRNIERNFEENNPDKATLAEFKKRAEYLEDTFLSHLVATPGVAENMGVHPLELKGSIAGAIGYPQFLPGNVAKFGVDGDKDGHINLFEPADAIPSVGKYLAEHGWHRDKMSVKSKRDVIRTYNSSDPYISTVLAMAADFDRVFSAVKHTKQRTRKRK